MFAKPTRALEDAVNKGRFTMVTLPEVTSFTPLKGGVPIVVGGHIIGAIGVSGAASADQDDEIAQAAVDAFTRTLAVADSVTHLDHAAVSAAFKSGAHLVRGPGYKVDASRRDASGEAEIHTQDTDVFYVVSGRATFVTGGEMVDPHTTAPNEIRGRVDSKRHDSEARGRRRRRRAERRAALVPDRQRTVQLLRRQVAELGIDHAP